MTATVFVATVLAVLSSLVGEASGACSLWIPVAAGPGDVTVLAVATDARVSIDPETDLPERGWRHTADGPLPEVWGQMFTVVDHRGAPRAEWLSSQTLVVVPWEYDPACRLEPWSDSVWVAVGDTVVFTLSSTSRAAVRPYTYHVLGWHAPYPTGELIRYRFRNPKDDPWLRPREYFEMLRILPAAAERRGGSRKALEQFKTWAVEQDLLNHFPVKDIIWFWEREARWGG